jgi:hypothetical protein
MSHTENMMKKSVKVSKSHRGIKAILSATFPEYKGRKVSVELTDKAYLDTVGGGGTYDRAVAVSLRDGSVAGLPLVSPFSLDYAAQQAGIALPQGVALVVHSMFCGKDAGIRIYIAPTTIAALDTVTLAGMLEG